MTTKEYEVALSFAGEDRAYVDMVADQLRARSVSVFYDKYEEADLWGKDLYTHLIEVYMKRARYTLMFISVHYKAKVWTNHERKAAQARALQESGEYILPARFDDTEVDGILPTMAFLDLRQRSPAEVAVLLCDKLGRNPFQQKAHAVPSLRNPSLTGTATFNYSSHNGRFRIGDSQHEFETIWSKAGNTSIYCYTDTPSLRGVALAPNGAKVNEVSDASTLDFTSRTRCPEIGRVVVLQNTHGLFAALEITSIKNESRGDPEDELQFRYWILTDGTADFSGINEL